MGDETIGNTDDPLDAFNARVEAEQEDARWCKAEALAAETGLGAREAYALLSVCRWSLSMARRAIQGKLTG